MHSNNLGRHRKPSTSRTFAKRAAVSAGGAVAAVLVTASGAGATAVAAAPTADTPPLAISCTGYPIDAFTTCATGGHYGKGSDRGDASGGDTPVLGGPPA